MDFAPTTPIADIVSMAPDSMKVFERYQIDFCCGGKRPIGEVCAAQGVSLDALRADIAAAGTNSDSDTRTWTSAPLTELVQHIVSRYHGKLKQDLPGLSRMSEKVAEVHGDRHPETREVAGVYQQLRAEMESHMMKEEGILFPIIVQVDQGNLSHPMAAHISHPIHVMEQEHESAGAALARMRALSGGFAVPSDGCKTYEALYAGLDELERDLHAHIHLENNILFPRAIRAISCGAV